MYYSMLQCPRQITLVLFDLYALCYFLTRWRLNKNTFNEKFLSLSFSRLHAENFRKREWAIDGHCNGRIRVSTLRYFETFYPPGRNTFNLIFFPSSLPSCCRRWRDELPRKRGTCCVVQGHIEDADESERIFRYQSDRKNRNKTEGNCVRVSASRDRWYWPKFDDTRSRLRWSCSW